MESFECVFCKTSSSDENLGEIGQLFEYSFHSNCLVYSWDIRQNPDKSKGLYGFEITNIQFALNRAKERICSFCSEKGASLKCYQDKCSAKFHLPCALESKKTLHIHANLYQSYCYEHIPDQYHCLFDDDPITGITSTVGCCKQIYSHEECMKKHVNEAKSAAKCPLCQNVNNFRTFVETQLECKIPSGKPEYAQRPNMSYDVQCSAKICVCPYFGGRFCHIEKTDYELILCVYCGSDATHRICGQVDSSNRWTCPACDCNSDFAQQPIGTNRKRTDDKISETNKKKIGEKEVPANAPIENSTKRSIQHQYGLKFKIILTPLSKPKMN